jgi:hypothetical protein
MSAGHVGRGACHRAGTACSSVGADPDAAPLWRIDSYRDGARAIGLAGYCLGGQPQPCLGGIKGARHRPEKRDVAKIVEIDAPAATARQRRLIKVRAPPVGRDAGRHSHSSPTLWFQNMKVYT